MRPREPTSKFDSPGDAGSEMGSAETAQPFAVSKSTETLQYNCGNLMTFEELLDGAEVLSRSGDPEVTGIDYDSRRIRPGYAFFAIRGEMSDGNRFVDAALKAGAVAVVTEKGAASVPSDVAIARVAGGRRALARASANLLGHPAEHLAILALPAPMEKARLLSCWSPFSRQVAVRAHL